MKINAIKSIFDRLIKYKKISQYKPKFIFRIKNLNLQYKTVINKKTYFKLNNFYLVNPNHYNYIYNYQIK